MSYVKEVYSAITSNKIAFIGDHTYTPEVHKDQLKFELTSQVLALRKAVMFKLPVDGVVLEDDEYKAIAREDDVRFPFGTMTLEFKNADSVYSKIVILIDDILIQAVDMRSDSPEMEAKIAARQDLVDTRPLIITAWAYSPKRHGWGQFPTMILPTHEWNVSRDGELAVKLTFMNKDVSDSYADDFVNPIMSCLMGFLNAVSCSNVEAHPIKPHRVGAKPPLPFDDYYTLTIGKPKGKGEKKGELGFDRHGPREHLRRGHIRRLQTGKRVWVNAAVINAGAAGAIHKEYKVAEMA